MKNLINKAKNKVQEMKAAVMAKDKGGKEIIVELGLAAIAVALLMVYRTEINGLVTGIMSQANNACELINIDEFIGELFDEEEKEVNIVR